LAARRIDRRYLALAHNRFPVPTGTIEAPIGRDPAQPTRRAVVPTGKPSVTHYEVMEELAGGEVSLLEVRLDTGRTHQIRVHLAAIDHPVLGDRTYAGAPFRATAPRVMLHARTVGFEHPVTGGRIVVEAPLPGDMAEVIARLRGSGS
jgi:23S rRNA pseudouridine1911/1915/1917 synthase